MAYEYRGKQAGALDPWQQPRPPTPRRTSPAPVEDWHGTIGGRNKHTARGEKPCEACRLRWNEYMAERRGVRFTGRKNGPVECGTPSGLKTHYARGEEPCGRCRAAGLAYRQELRTRQSEEAALEAARAHPVLGEWLRVPLGSWEAGSVALRSVPKGENPAPATGGAEAALHPVSTGKIAA